MPESPVRLLRLTQLPSEGSASAFFSVIRLYRLPRSWFQAEKSPSNRFWK